MSEGSNPDVQRLVQEGVQAIRDGDKQVGRGKLEAAVQMEPYNEMAWFWLASVVETEEEKRTCLGNVIIINPHNNKAQEMLRRLEGQTESRQAEEARARGGAMLASFQQQAPALRYGLIALSVLVALALVGVLALALFGEDDVEVPEQLIIPTTTPTLSAEQLAAIEGATATAQASITPTLTPARVGNVATWTPIPSPTLTPTAESIQLPTPPPDVPGRIILQSGLVAGDLVNQPIAVVQPGDLSTYEIVSATNQRGQAPALEPGSDRFAWAQYQSGTRTLVLQIQRFGREEATNIVTLYAQQPMALSDLNQPDWYNDWLTFSANAFNATSDDIWLLNTTGEHLTFTTTATPTPTLAPIDDSLSEEEAADEATPTPSPTPEIISLYRLTEEDSQDVWPRFSPDGAQIVYTSVLEGVTDLQIVDVFSRQRRALTSNGNDLVEGEPDWGATDEIVFAADSLLYIMPADGNSEPALLLEFDGTVRQPRFSPEARYVAFSSNRNGNWDVYILERETDRVYALTNNEQSIDIANDWVP